jgi:hypothetical protein
MITQVQSEFRETTQNEEPLRWIPPASGRTAGSHTSDDEIRIPTPHAGRPEEESNFVRATKNESIQM